MAKPKETMTVPAEKIVNVSFTSNYYNINVIAHLDTGEEIRLTGKDIGILLSGHDFKVTKERKYFYIDEVI